MLKEDEVYEDYFRITSGGNFEDFKEYKDAETYLRKIFKKDEVYASIRLIRFKRKRKKNEQLSSTKKDKS